MSRPKRRKPKGKKPDASERMNRLKAKALTQVAGQAWALNQRHKTIALLTEALRREPKNPKTIVELAAAHGKQRNYEQAEQLLIRLFALAPRKASLYRQAAQVYAVIDRPERAVEYYQRCLELYGDKSLAVPALLELASLYERRHQVDEARAAVTEALKYDSANAEARLQMAMLLRRAGDASQAESKLRTLVSEPSRDWRLQADAWYELAQLLDSAGQYDAAFEALQSAKKLLKPHAAPYKHEAQMEVLKTRELAEEIDHSCYQRWTTAAENDAPFRFAVLTGHPRSGTTLVEQVIDGHDDAISSDELDVVTHWIYLPIVTRFPITQSVLSILDRVPEAVRQQARATYWKQTEAVFNQPIGARLLIDKNPAMTSLLPVVNWAFPEAKILIALRDPRDVILSCFMQRLPLNSVSVHWLGLADAADYYAHTMETWLAVRKLTASPWLEFRYEDVVADLEGQARRILDFLGLPWDEKVLRFYEHAQAKLVRSPTYQDVTRPVYQGAVGRWQHYAKHFEPLMPKLESFLKEFGYSG